MPNTRHLGLAALLVTGSLFALPGGASAAGETAGIYPDKIVLGTTNPLTGTVASACKPVSDGALAWFDKVNTAGGVHGRKIENIVLDDQYTAQQALANVRELAKKPVFAIFGGCGTIQVPAILQVTKREGMPYLFPYAGFEPLLKEDKVFLLMPLYAAQFKALIPSMLKENGPGSVFVVAQRVPGADQTVADVKAAVKAAGGTIAGEALTIAGQSDQTPLALKIKQAAPDYVLMAEAAPDAARIFKVLQSQDAFPKKFVIGQSTMATGAFINPTGSIADNRMRALSPTAPEDSQDAAECNAALEAKGIKPDGFSLFGCATAQAMVAALQDAGAKPTRTGLVKALRTWKDRKVGTVVPPLSFSKKSNMGEKSMILIGVEKGKFVKKGVVPLH